MQVTIFKKFTEVVAERPIKEVLEEIRNPKNPPFFEHLRDLYRNGENEKYDKAKKGLTAFTASGTFKDGRTPKILSSYSGLIVLDFDKLGEALQEVRTAITTDSHTYACFLSPSGDGLKVLVQVSTKQEEHGEMYRAIADYYGRLTGMAIDTSGKDVTRLCFMSYDPDIYINEQSEPFDLPEQEETGDLNEMFAKCVELTNKKLKFEEGQRNNYVFLLASNCKRSGIPHEHSAQLIMATYAYDEKEAATSIKSAYQNSPEEFAKFASTSTPRQNSSESEINLASTPFIPDDVIDILPDLLKEPSLTFTDKRERDVFLTGALSVLSACFDNVTGVYDQKEVYPNLYSFIVAPAASGKGALKYSKELGALLHKNFQLAAGQLSMKVLFIPGNISSSAIIKLINESDGNGIIFETETDTLTNTLKKEWGNIDDMLRKAFQHETISIARITNNQFDEIDNPRLSIALSGTPEQVKGLIPSAENGLFSRFIFYAFKSPIIWKDVRPNPTISYIDLFEKLSKEVVVYRDFLKANPTKFDLTQPQWDEHKHVFERLLQDLTQFISLDTAGTVKRLGLIFYRIAMIMTILRKAEKQLPDQNVKCSDVDFEIARKIAMTYLEHAKTIYTTLPRSIKIDPVKRRFYDALPAKFERKKAVEVGQIVGIKERTVDNYLSDLLGGGQLAQPNYGIYNKP